MPTKFPPEREAQLLAASANFSQKISLSPALYGLNAGQATDYQMKHTVFAGAYALVTDPTTRTRAKVAAKNTAKKSLVKEARMLARIVQATPTVTDEQRVELGLPVRKPEPTPINPPAVSPIMEVVDRFGTTIRVRLHDGSGTRRGKPTGVQGASLFSYIGATPSPDVNLWKFEGQTTKTTAEVQFAPTTAPGTTVYLSAFWYSPTGQSGPGCAPVPTTVVGGGLQQAA